MTLGAAIAAAAARLGGDAAAVLARVGGALGDDARAALATSSTRGARAAAIAAWRAPLPPGLGAIDASWREAAVAELPARARAVLAGDAPLDATDVWLARWACAAFPAMTPAPAGAHAWLVAIGEDQLALALGDAAAQLPALRAAAARIAAPPRAGALGPRRAAIARARVALDDPHRDARIGARALAPHLAGDPLARRRLVLQLPRTLGLAIAAELRAHANDSLADAPRRDALGAWPIESSS